MPNFYPSLTNRQGLIVWGGVASTDYGMVVSQAPAYDKPTRRVEAVTVPGRNGSILFDEGAFSDTTRTYNVFITEDMAHSVPLSDRVNALTAWLFSNVGYTRLEDNFEPDVFRLAYYSGGNDVTNELMQYGESELTFTCRPERFLKSGTTAIEVDDGDMVDALVDGPGVVHLIEDLQFGRRGGNRIGHIPEGRHAIDQLRPDRPQLGLARAQLFTQAIIRIGHGPNAIELDAYGPQVDDIGCDLGQLRVQMIDPDGLQSGFVGGAAPRVGGREPPVVDE